MKSSELAYEAEKQARASNWDLADCDQAYKDNLLSGLHGKTCVCGGIMEIEESPFGDDYRYECNLCGMLANITFGTKRLREMEDIVAEGIRLENEQINKL